MQVVMSLSDVTVDFLVQPFLAFPLLGGYCRGLLCRAGVDVGVSIVSTCSNSLFLASNLTQSPGNTFGSVPRLLLRLNGRCHKDLSALRLLAEHSAGPLTDQSQGSEYSFFIL